MGLNAVLFELAAQKGVEMPSLYDTEVVYRRERPGQEWWETALDVLHVTAKGQGDCEDLSNYMSAWYRVFEGDDAQTRIVRTTRGTFHAVVQRGDGSVEDPSRILVDQERERKQRGKKR